MMPVGIQPQQLAGAAASSAAAPAQMVFVQAPAGAQQGMQYQYIMPAAAGGSGVSVPAPPGGAWVQVCYIDSQKCFNKYTTSMRWGRFLSGGLAEVVLIQYRSIDASCQSQRCGSPRIG